MKHDRASYAGLLLFASAIFVLHTAHYWSTWIDDAYITFRYGRNLMAGEGLVFNPGERVEGITNLAWCLLTAPFTAGDPIFAARIIGTAFSIGTLALLVGWARAQALHPVAGALAVAPWVLLPWAPFWAVQGLETPAVAFFVTLGWSRYAGERDGGERDGGGRRWPLAALGLGLAPAFRPDAAVYAPLVALWHLWRAPVAGWRAAFDRHAARSAGIVVLCAALLIGFKLWWFGAILPNTFWAKARPWPWPNGWQYAASFYQVPGVGFAAVATLAVGIAALGAFRRDPRALPALVVVTGFAGAIASNGDFFANFRLLVPVLPAVGACLALVAQSAITRDAVLGGCAAVVAAAGMFLPQIGVAQADRLRDDTAYPKTVALVTPKSAPLWAPQRSADWRRGMVEQWVYPAAWTFVNALPAERVAFTDIGLLSFFTPNPIVDLLGLTDPRLVPPRDVPPAEHWRRQRREIPERTEFLVLERGSDRWQRLKPENGELWRTVSGCGNVRIYASRLVTRTIGTDHTQALPRVERMFTHMPHFPPLHIAVIRELAAAGAGPAVLAPLVDRAQSLSSDSMQFNFEDLRCQVGIREGCALQARLCSGAAPQERPEAAAP